MADQAPYQAGKPVSAGQLNRTHKAATRGDMPSDSMRMPFGTFQRGRRRGGLRRFELKDDLTADNTAATAYLLDYDSTADEYAIDEDTEFELYSFSGFTGEGRKVNGEDVTDGARGWCVKKSGRWEVVGGGEGGSGRRVSGLLTAATTGSDFTIDNVKPISGSSPLDDPDSLTETIAVSNVFSWDGDDNGRVHAEYNVTSGNWEAYQVECPA